MGSSPPIIDQIVSRAQRSASKASAALQTRDRSTLRVWNGPGSAAHRFALHRVRDTGDYSLSGNRMMKLSWFGIFTFGSVCAFITSFSPMILFSDRMYAVSA